MLISNKSGFYPTILLHRSHFGELVVGGPMNFMVHKNRKEVEEYQAHVTSGGWNTRFDGGYDSPSHISCCNLVVMYVRGMDTENPKPECYSEVLFQKKKEGKLCEKSIYLQAPFSLSDRLSHDGVYDLKFAHEYAIQLLHARPPQESNSKEKELGFRDWAPVDDELLPQKVAAALKKSIDTMKEALLAGFGQGKSFFSS